MKKLLVFILCVLAAPFGITVIAVGNIYMFLMDMVEVLLQQGE